jgi:anthranilate synthase component 1
MILPSYEEFEKAAASWPVVPVYKEILADLETPVSAFRKLAAGSHAVLLESLEGGETWGRYSMIGCDPSLIFESAGRQVTVTEGERKQTWDEERPLKALDRILGDHRTATIPGLPRMAGGAIGFASYDMARRFEKLPEIARDDLGVPDSRFVFFETMVLFDHQTRTVKVLVNPRHGGDPKEAYRRAVERIDDITARLAQADSVSPELPEAPAVRFSSTVSREQFLQAVDRAKEYIRAGDVVQVVLAHRLEAEVAADPFDVYRALRVINPSPYMFFLRLDDLILVGSSPEVLVRREGAKVETRPIAGTRPRGDGDEADRLLEEELRDSEKERAEHLMLVDLGRNDLGRISAYGTVRTTEFMAVERYSHVMHLVSHVVGELGNSFTNADILEACFPAGTVSGAPKIRAMEIIDELEPVRRGVYAGAIGYMDYHGNMDTCIAIRTLLFRNGKAYLGVGAGIVADSDPAAEYEETMRKGSALMRACELAQQGLSAFSRMKSNLPHDGAPRRSEEDGTQRRSGEEGSATRRKDDAAPRRTAKEKP